MLKNKKVLLGVTGSIAAYKTAELVRLFKKSEAQIKVIQTPSSLNFVTPLTLSTLSENQVLHEMIDSDTEIWNDHVKLALWADFMVIAPLTANTMSKMVNGTCDNLLLATYLSAKCPVFFAPAMDLDMYNHFSTTSNIDKLKKNGNILIPSGFGELASGLYGEGRMAEPKEIIDAILNDLNKELPLNGKNILITAGPTHEFIDPVRYISNKSSGKMGVALALEFANNGAKVDLVLGPTNIECKHSNINIRKIDSASEMYSVVDSIYKDADVSIFAAAVCDFKLKNIISEKLKIKNKEINMSFIANKDIAKEMGKKKKANQINIGFALESNNEIENAKNKLKDKNFDMIILNSLKDKGAGFDYDTNKITIIDNKYSIYNYNLKIKSEVARDIFNKLIEII